MRGATATALAASCWLVATVATAGEPSPVVPVFVVEARGQIDADLVEELTGALDAPVVSGPDLATALGLLGALDEADHEQLLASSHAAQDLFFSGDHDAALAAFEGILDRATRDLAVLADPRLGEAVFDAFLYAATIAHGEGDQPAVDRLLSRAAARFPERSPDAVEFPPWVRERFDAAREALGAAGGTVVLEGSPPCELQLDGRQLGPGPRITGVRSGDHVVRALCLGDLGPPRRLEVRDGEATPFRPLLLKSVRAELRDGSLILVARHGTAGERVAADVGALAREGGWERAVAVVAGPGGHRALLVHAGGGVIREMILDGGGPAGVGGTARYLAGQVVPPVATIPERDPAAWYEDPLAWSLVGVGAAALGVGLALGQVYGTPSAEEPVAWALIAAGGGVAGTGVALLIVPEETAGTGDTAQRRPLVGASVTVSF